MHSHTTFTLIPVFALVICTVLAAGPSGYGMVPKTAEPTYVNQTKEKEGRSRPQELGFQSASSGHKLRQVRSTTQWRTKRDWRRCSVYDECSYVEQFKYRNGRWIAADGYANGSPFDAWWSKSSSVINDWAGLLSLSVGNARGFGKNFVGGQLQTTTWQGYGCYEVRMKPVKQEGLITTFFSYTGKWDAHPGASGKHNEVDIEFVWKKYKGKLMMQCNYFTDGRGGNEHYIDLPFEPDKRFHNYGFRWRPNRIEWFVDGRKVYTAWKNIPKASDGRHKIMMNFWPVLRTAARWGGYYTFKGQRTAVYDAVRFTKGVNCRIRNKF